MEDSKQTNTSEGSSSKEVQQDDVRSSKTGSSSSVGNIHSSALLTSAGQNLGSSSQVYEMPREWPSSPGSHRSQEAPKQDPGSSSAASMLQRWQEEPMRHQPYHDIETIKAMHGSKVNLDENPGRTSSNKYYDPEEQKS